MATANNEKLTSLYKSIPCREEQILELYELIGMANEVLPPVIFLHGMESTGKTYVATRLIKMLGYRSAMVSCECYSPKLLFEPILNQLTKHELKPETNYMSYAKCESTLDFIENIISAASSLHFENEPCVILLENSEKLRNKEGHLLPTLCRLREFTSLNICVILMSDVAFELFHTEVDVPCIEIEFPQYSQDEALEILMLNQKSGYPDDFYQSYLKLLIQLFFKDCRNISELHRVASDNLNQYCEPIVNGTVEQGDANKLWRNLRPHLKNVIEDLHCNSLQARKESQPNQLQVQQDELSFTEKWALGYELPYYTKYLLMAAYLASYNPVKTDRRIFSKAHEKKRKTMASLNQKKMIDQILGPKFFSMDRLFAIFYAIIDEKLPLTVNLQSQISSLVRLQLLALSSDDCIDSPKLKCTVTLDFIKVIAKNTGFNIMKHIYNLM